MSMSAWKLLGNCWDRPRETFPNHQLLIPNHVMGLWQWWCGIKDSDCLGLFEGKTRLTLFRKSIYRTSGSQQFKKWRLKTWKRLEILPFALVHGLARVFPLVMFVVFIFYKPISTIKPTYLTYLQTNLPAVIKHGNGHPQFSSLNIPLRHHDCRGFSHSHTIYMIFQLTHYYYYHYWLVVYLPLWKIMEWVTVGMMTFHSQYILVKSCHPVMFQPVTPVRSTGLSTLSGPRLPRRYGSGTRFCGYGKDVQFVGRPGEVCLCIKPTCHSFIIVIVIVIVCVSDYHSSIIVIYHSYIIYLLYAP